jgi:hypothetical protein
MDFLTLEQYMNNPSRLINVIISDIENAVENNGGKINGKGHPFTYALDTIVATNYGFISRSGDNVASLYPVHARNIKDLSRVMSDEDWVGIFAEPSSTMFRWVAPEESLKKAAIPFTEVSENMQNNYKKLELAADTQFYVAGIPFLLENPVEVRILEHGGYQVLYDSNYYSPLKPLVSNSPDKELLDINNVKHLAIHLPVRQLEVTEEPSHPVNITTGYKKVVSFKDNIYAVRAFITPDGTTERREMSIVYNNDIYDPNQPTLTIDMIDGSSFEASIPSVYLQNGTTLGRLTILTYTTRGRMNQDLSLIRTQEHKVTYRDYRYEKGKVSEFTSPLVGLGGVFVDSIAPIQGGRFATTFEDLKNMVIYGNRRRRIPISNSDLDRTLQDMGYDSAKAIDSLGRRLFRTTGDLPTQSNKIFEDDVGVRTNTTIGTYTGSILTSIEELVGSGNAIDNGKRVTIRRGSVFDITEQTSRLVPLYEVNQLLAAGNQFKIDTMAGKSLVYLPFMYVLDISNDRAVVRTYRTATPEIRYQTFLYENSTLGVQIGVGEINIKSTDEGYVIDIKTKSDEGYKKLDDALLGAQISFKSSDSNSPAIKRGTLVGKVAEGERIFRFTLPSRYDIDANDEIDLRGFNQFGQPQNLVRVALDVVANFIFTYSADGQILRSAADFKIDQTLFNGTTIAMIETEYRVSFGKILSSMYTRITPMVGEARYEKYPNNVPELYDKDEFKRGPDGKLVIENGKAIMEHPKGTPVYNTDGSPRWLYLAGQTVYDDNGKPVLKKPRELLYYWDYVGLDFNYQLSQDAYDKEYVTTIENFFADQVNDEIGGITKKLLDETIILFKPRSTMGFTQVVMNEGVKKTIRTDVRLSVNYYLTAEGMMDADLKQALTDNTHVQANKMLAKDTFSVSELVQSLRNTDVIDVRVSAMAGLDNIDVITNIDDTNGFSVRKLLDQTSDRLLTIKEDIDITFLRHISVGDKIR